MRLEQVARLGEQLLASRVAEPVDDEGKAGQDTAGCHELVLLAVEVGGLLERLPRILEPSLLLGGLCPSLHQRRAGGVS